MESFFETRKRIITAIAFDEYTHNLVNASVNLAKKTGKELRLVHVVEPWMETAHSRPFTHVSPLWDVTQAIEKNARSQAETRLKELIATISDVNIDYRIFSGVPADVLMAEATANEGALIVVGTGHSTTRFLPGGFSTAYTLMVHSPVPVMVLHSGQAISAKESYKILCADDLTAGSEPAVEFSFDLASQMQNTEFHHVHINGMTKEALAAGLETAKASARTNVTDALSADDIFATIESQLRDKLAARSQGKEEYLEGAGGEYQTQVLTGRVTEELHRYAEEIDPDLIVYGRHHTIHKRPFTLGNHPFRAMLAEHRPFIVVPDET